MLVAVGSDVFYHFGAFDRSSKMSSFTISHLLSDLQGQNLAEVGLFCCFEERCNLSPFSFFKRIPHSGHWFVLGCESLSFLLSSLQEYLYSFAAEHVIEVSPSFVAHVRSIFENFRTFF